MKPRRIEEFAEKRVSHGSDGNSGNGDGSPRLSSATEGFFQEVSRLRNQIMDDVAF